MRASTELIAGERTKGDEKKFTSAFFASDFRLMVLH
jgi:hypothetical protein